MPNRYTSNYRSFTSILLIYLCACMVWPLIADAITLDDFSSAQQGDSQPHSTPAPRLQQAAPLGLSRAIQASASDGAVTATIESGVFRHKASPTGKGASFILWRNNKPAKKKTLNFSKSTAIEIGIKYFDFAKSVPVTIELEIEDKSSKRTNTYRATTKLDRPLLNQVISLPLKSFKSKKGSKPAKFSVVSAIWLFINGSTGPGIDISLDFIRTCGEKSQPCQKPLPNSTPHVNPSLRPAPERIADDTPLSIQPIQDIESSDPLLTPSTESTQSPDTGNALPPNSESQTFAPTGKEKSNPGASDPSATGEVIVKFRGLEASASSLFRMKRRFPKKLEDLNTALGVQDITPLFRDAEQEKQFEKKHNKPIPVEEIEKTETLDNLRLSNKLRKAGRKVSSRPPSLAQIHRIKTAPGIDAAEAARRYAEDPNVEFAQPNYVMAGEYVPNDPFYSTQALGTSKVRMWRKHGT
jgi:hypothetical protein